MLEVLTYVSEGPTASICSVDVLRMENGKLCMKCGMINVGIGRIGQSESRNGESTK
jgi:hypothetical protein